MIPNPWSRAHWLVGTISLALFPLAGVYMRFVARVPELEDAPRLVFRSRFLFLLLIAVANLSLSTSHPRGLMQRLAAGLILAAPVALVFSFFFDPARGVLSSPWTVFTMRGLFLAGLLLVIAHRPRRQF
jgi:hypothetical protein